MFLAMSSEVTQLLGAMKSGDTASSEALLSAVYEELRQLARGRMAQEAEGHTLQPTALVHEAWLRLGADAQETWENRAHFFGAAAEAMRRILVDSARRRQAAKRGGGAQKVELEELHLSTPAKDDAALLSIHEALDKLAEVDARKAELVKLRYFVGMTFSEAALAMGIAVPTAKRWWAYARAYLAIELKDGKKNLSPE